MLFRLAEAGQGKVKFVLKTFLMCVGNVLRGFRFFFSCGAFLKINMP